MPARVRGLVGATARVGLASILALSSGGLSSPARAAAQAPDQAAQILAVMRSSAAAWNRGDLAGFAASYDDSPDILFIGRTVSHGYAQMLAAYRAHYPTPARMGRLEFSNLAVQPLDPRFATVTGRFHLARSARDGGNADGYFLLVFKQTAQGWKIVRDDSTALPAPRPCATTNER
ncbi:MAG: nuclear transport factor 2 family protein [Gammaproteobacteria bacterium]|nr:nuclear transport factor 2 family protein [Gammaproteobacteria bacterium]